MEIDENLAVSVTGNQTCTHCGTLLAQEGEPHLARALVREVAATDLGPQVRVAPERYTAAAVSARLTLCPGCLTQLRVSVGPHSESDYRTREMSGEPCE